MMKYDFILFEDLYDSVNHYKDVCIIARMLNDCGYSVAIADVFREAQFCSDAQVPIISLSTKKTRATLSLSKSNFSIFRVIQNMWNRFRIDLYLKKVVIELSHLTNNIYAGTMHMGMPILWMKRIPSSVNIYLWGLRSYYLTYYKSRSFKIETIESKWLYSFFKSHANFKFIISDEIILKEFQALGFPTNRLILRPERLTDSICYPINRDSITKILCIGTLRPQKRIDICLDAFSAISHDNIEFTIAGKAYSDHGYDKLINSKIFGSKNVIRVDKRLNEEEYQNLFRSCDYLLLCDEKQLSSVTNGTMNEALLSGKPIIAPNHDPYKYVVERYNVGILYDLHNQESIKRAFLEAQLKSPLDFSDGLVAYQKTLMYNDAVASLKKQIEKD